MSNISAILICNACDHRSVLDDNSTGYCESCGSANVRRGEAEVRFVMGNDEPMDILIEHVKRSRTEEHKALMRKGRREFYK